MAREITIMKLLRHPNVLKLYDIFETDDKMFALFFCFLCLLPPIASSPILI